MPLKKAAVSVYDLGVLRGYGVFDVMCTHNGKPFLIEDHWKRFLNSARELNLKVPISLENYKNVIRKLLDKNGYKKSIIRTVLTGGESPDGFSHQLGEETFFILIEKFIPIPKNIFMEGAKVITLDYCREIPHAKITNYLQSIRRQAEKKKNGALEIIYVNQGKALEASTSNFFIVKNGKIITTNKGILFGITRNKTIDIAKKSGFEVKERDVSVKELFKADEVFLTATNKDIVPVVEIDGKKIGSGKVGEMTKMLMKAFGELIKKY